MSKLVDRVFETMEDLLTGNPLKPEDAARYREKGEVVTHFSTRYGTYSILRPQPEKREETK